ncbi:MAG: 30S ribosomal protein S6, partial [Actinobacteria bacterium]|nr:30S ribosomal protein S6 [Actinomycetota bacterium]
MRGYELMIILDGSLDEPVAQQWVATVTKAVKAAGGDVHGKADWWGKRRLAYPINKKEDGFYVVFNIAAAGGALDELERSLRIADDVLRHKLLRLPE